MIVHGIDFTSAPSRAKPITVATGRIEDGVFILDRLSEIPTFAAFDGWLRQSGPWIGGFDFPFGLPRQAVHDLGWPSTWCDLVRHCASLGRDAFRSRLDWYRGQRPIGNKYPYRRGDAAAGSHSPIKLVNPPVALMFLEGAPRLLASDVDIPCLCRGDPNRVAIEAYPGYAVRRILQSRSRVSYKNDARAKQSAPQRLLRMEVVRRIGREDTPCGIRVGLTREQRQALIEDGRGDRLDAVLCALQAAYASRRKHANYGLPALTDPLEGWIATVPAPARTETSATDAPASVADG